MKTMQKRRVGVSEKNRRVGEDHPRARLSQETVDRIRDYHEEEGWSYRKLAQHFSVSKSTIAGLCCYRTRSSTPVNYRTVPVKEKKEAECPKDVEGTQTPMTGMTPKQREVFLETLMETCNVSRAANAIGLSRNCVYEWRKKDAEFAQAWEEAKAIGADRLEDEAVRRALEGDPMFYKGELLAEVKRTDNDLLKFLLRGAKPDKYGLKANRIELVTPTVTAVTEAQLKTRAWALLNTIESSEEA